MRPKFFVSSVSRYYQRTFKSKARSLTSTQVLSRSRSIVRAMAAVERG
ncbi:MAG: hypothetical protein ACI9Y1_003508, partial [Lentisphaeria bacterium]